MNLTLEVVSPNGQSLGAARKRVFGPEGGRIGRAADCEWVLANPYISRLQATVRCIGGAYHIESSGENRVAVNSPQAAIPPFKPCELRNGDRLYLDEYEIAVTLDTAQFAALDRVRSAPAPTPAENSFDDLEPTRDTPSLAGAFDSSQEEVDPLRRLSGRSAVRQPEPKVEEKPHWNHTSGLNDYYAPPPVPPSLPSQEELIPENWDKTSFGRNQVVSDPSAAKGALKSGASDGDIPENWDEPDFGRKENSSPPPLDGARQPVVGNPQVGAAGSKSARHSKTVQVRAPSESSANFLADARNQKAVPLNPNVSPPSTNPPPLAEPPKPKTRAGGFDVEEFLRAAGLDPATVPPETAASLGQILRTVIQGMVEVLHSRAQVKDQFRLATTRIMTQKNNPLKFAVNAESALAFLLGRRDPAYLEPVEAFEDAMNDIRFHQLAMLSGMRAGFDQMLKHFDPSHLQQGFDKGAKRGGLLALGAKSRYWEQYIEEYGELNGDPEAAFRRVFGEAFGIGYEKQLNTLKTGHGKLKR